MPTYEYLGTNPDCELCNSIFEIVQSIKDKALDTCPQCNLPIEKQVSLISGHVIRGREANQFKEIQQAKYWRDKNGVRHKVTPSDGSSKSATVSKQTNSPEKIAAIKKRDAAADKKIRFEESYKRYVKRVTKNKK